jgi:hypothetical protein
MTMHAHDLLTVKCLLTVKSMLTHIHTHTVQRIGNWDVFLPSLRSDVFSLWGEDVATHLSVLCNSVAITRLDQPNEIIFNGP